MFCRVFVFTCCFVLDLLEEHVPIALHGYPLSKREVSLCLASEVVTSDGDFCGLHALPVVFDVVS